MSDGLEINTNLFANRGTIARRDFALNMVYLGMITTFFSVPFNIWAIHNTGGFSDLIEINKFVFSAPFFHIVLLMFAMAVSVVIGISNIKRRIADIGGKEDNISKYVISAIWILASLWMFLPFPFLIFISSLNSMVIIFLLCKKGQITSKLPYDISKDFNWGAFFCAPLWALVNNTYKPLWMILLLLTPFSGHFSLVCGLKGNEWYFKKHTQADVKTFKKKQKTQTIIMFLCSGLFLPILITIVVSVFAGFMMSMAIKSPEFAKSLDNNFVKLEKFAQDMEQMVIEKYFVEYKIYGAKNEFFINDEAWNTTPFDDKIKVLELAAQMAAEKRNNHAANPDIKASKYTELPKTKLYSATTKKLIGEYNPNFESASSELDQIQAHIMGYKFQNVTK